MSLPVIVLAGGGTGGHVFPMIAVGDALRAEADVRVVYIGTARGIESRVVPERGDDLEVLDIVPIKGGGVRGALRGISRAAMSLPRARSLVKRLSARAVLAVGGYAAGPVGLAAWSARVPVAIHEPNHALGLANRWLLPFARRAYVAFADTATKMRPGVAVRTGVPLRGSFLPVAYAPHAGRFHVLVLGGSQGAKALNEIVPPSLADAGDDIDGLTVVHQAGRGREDETRRRYAELGMSGRASVVPFLDDVATELARADLVIQRAGASSLAELCAIGRPSILIPFPFAADDHQQKNAEALAFSGAAIVVSQADATVDRLAGQVVSLAKDERRRMDMAAAAQAQGRPDAARTVARDLLALAGLAQRSGNPSAEGTGELRVGKNGKSGLEVARV
ncbi:MAG TPA: undecaprenyldiphospho-muramoylpentapeptide beta-N-acetylglucosaminyltransferase [Polyangiaceae bacterium]